LAQHRSTRGVPKLSGTDAAICITIVVAGRKGMWYCLNVLRVSVQNFTQLDGRDYFLCPFILRCLSGLMWFCDRSGKGRAVDFVQVSKKCDGDIGNNQKGFRERKHEPYTEDLNSPKQKIARQLKGNMHLKIIEPLETAHKRKRSISRAMIASRPKVGFWPDRQHHSRKLWT
jgi:hypothetical protein